MAQRKRSPGQWLGPRRHAGRGRERAEPLVWRGGHSLFSSPSPHRRARKHGSNGSAKSWLANALFAGRPGLACNRPCLGCPPAWSDQALGASWALLGRFLVASWLQLSWTRSCFSSRLPLFRPATRLLYQCAARPYLFSALVKFMLPPVDSLKKQLKGQARKIIVNGT